MIKNTLTKNDNHHDVILQTIIDKHDEVKTDTTKFGTLYRIEFNHLDMAPDERTTSTPRQIAPDKAPVVKLNKNVQYCSYRLLRKWLF